MSGVRYPPVPTMNDNIPQPSATPAAASGTPAAAQPARGSRGSGATASSTSIRMPWTLTGVSGGILLGATAGGPVGAVVGGLAGAIAGAFRDTTGKTVMQAFLDASDADKQKILEQAGFLLLGKNQAGPSTSAAAPDAAGLSAQELDDLPAAPAADGEPVCVLCMCSAVQVVFQPCGHAQVCGKCAGQVMRMAYTGACPVCRSSIQRISRVFVSTAAANGAAPPAAAPSAPGAPPDPRAPSAPPPPRTL